MRFISLFLVLVSLAACQQTQQVVTPSSPPPPEAPLFWSGVDSTLSKTADSLASKILVNAQAHETSRYQVQAALALLADSLLGIIQEQAEPVSPEQQHAATIAFNDGAEALTMYAEASDSARAAMLLDRAAVHFTKALEANPFDEEALYWLARVHLLQADSVDAAITVLERLVSLWGHRSEYVAMLAEAHERLLTPESGMAAGALWVRAAQLIIDDSLLDPESNTALDSAAIFSHYARGGRAFVLARQGDLALAAVDSAATWSTHKDEYAYVEAERRWILWDHGNLQTRTRFDSLLALATTDPGGAANGMTVLLQAVRRDLARAAIQHERALLWYRVGRSEEALRDLQSLANSALPVDSIRLREDYGTIAFNVGMAYRAEGDLRAALAYLLQSESTGFSQSARAALAASRILINDLDASFEVGLRAEAAMAQLSESDQKALLRHLIELCRRKGDLVLARQYVDQYRQLPR